MKIYHLDLISSSVDVQELKEKLLSIGIETNISSDLSFCPHFICVQNPEDGTVFADNTNDGHFSALKKKHEIIECRDLIELVENISEFSKSKKNNSSLNTLF